MPWRYSDDEADGASVAHDRGRQESERAIRWEMITAELSFAMPMYLGSTYRRWLQPTATRVVVRSLLHGCTFFEVRTIGSLQI